jgi:hypothetical protein
MSDKDTPDITPTILQQIRDDLRELRRDTNERFDRVNQRFDELSTSVNRRFDDVNVRFDNLILAAGAGRGDHERRLVRLESRVDRLEKRPKKT